MAYEFKYYLGKEILDCINYGYTLEFKCRDEPVVLKIKVYEYDEKNYEVIVVLFNPRDWSISGARTYIPKTASDIESKFSGEEIDSKLRDLLCKILYEELGDVYDVANIIGRWLRNEL